MNMDTVISAAKLVGGVTVSTTLGVIVDANTNVPLGVMFGVMGTVVVAAWWLSSKFTSIDDQLKDLRNSQKTWNELREAIDDIKNKTASLPCIIENRKSKCHE
jgi:hypothetical protein